MSNVYTGGTQHQIIAHTTYMYARVQYTVHDPYKLTCTLVQYTVHDPYRLTCTLYASTVYMYST